ncbi:MAG TPA: hypothetical protein VK624_01280 [Steroidobacteraceae bacterium]|nr:hypothetical protein [Steroidobacteraceae bacterium]
MPSRILLLFAFSLLSGCAHYLQLSYLPEAEYLPGMASRPFNLVVTDLRPYVTHAKKNPFYLGIIRSGYGIPSDVFNKKKLSLANQMKGDMRQELLSLGLVESPGPASPQVLVRIHDWNFDSAVSSRFWYDVEVSVTGPDGKPLATNRVKDTKIIDNTNVFKGGIPAMKKAMPAFYAELIHKLIRDDPPMLTALQLGR